MGNRSRTAFGRIGLAAAAWVLGIALMPSLSHAVEYTKVCEIPGYETDYYYIPGSDTCHNPSTNDARVETDGGLWRYRIPNNPVQWIQAPKKICRGGRLIEFGKLDNSDFFINAYGRVEATPTIALSLGEKEYISSVIYKGQLTNAGGDFCMYYHYVDVVEGSVYLPLGCGTPSASNRYPALLSYAPDMQPPDTTNPVFLVGASGRPWTPNPVTLGGTLEIWLCVKKAKL